VVYVFSITPRDYRRLYKPEVFEYYEAYPDKAFILVIVLCYSNIAPLILVFGLVYFLLMYGTESYRLLYVCRSKSHSGGEYWSIAFNEVCFGLILYNTTMTGILSLKGIFYGAVIGFLLILVVIYFCYYMNRWWHPILYFGAMEVLVQSDNIIEHDNEEFRQAYRHPGLKPIPEKKQEWYGEEEEQIFNGYIHDNVDMDVEPIPGYKGEQELNEIKQSPRKTPILLPLSDTKIEDDEEDYHDDEEDNDEESIPVQLSDSTYGILHPKQY